MEKCWSRSGRILLTLGASLACAVCLLAALGVEWRAAPEWCSPRKLFSRDAVCWNSWSPIVLAEAIQIALLVWIKKGRVLLGGTTFKVALVVALTLFRWQNVLAYAVLIGLSLLAGGMGRRILSILCPRLPGSTLERLVVSLSLGFGGLAIVALILGVLSELHIGIIAGTLGLLGLLFASDCKQLLVEAAAAARRAWANRPDDLRLAAVVVTLCALCLVPSLVVALSDDAEYDVLWYHLGVPQVYALEGKVVELPECVHSHFCHGVEMLYTLALVIAGQPLPQLMHFLSALLTAALLFGLGRRVGGPTCGWLASLFFYALPLVSLESGHAMSDLFATLYAFAAVYAAMRWLDSQYSPLLTLTGCFVGLAAGAKLSTLLFLLPLGVLVLVRTCWLSRSNRGAVRDLVLCGTASLLTVSPWLVFEWSRTGNPLFPFYNNVFRSPLWEPVNEALDLALSGIGQSVSGLFLLPWHVTAGAGVFGDHGWGGLEGLAFISLPLTVLLWDRRLWRQVWLPGGVLLGGCLVWYMRAQVLRYLLPLAPLMALFAAINATILWSALGTTSPRRALILGTGLTTLLCWFQGASWWAMKQSAAEGYPWHVAFGREDSKDALRYILPEYDLLRFLAARAESQPTRALAYPWHQQLYGGKCTLYGRAFSPDGLALQLGKQRISVTDGRAVAQALAAESIDYLLISRDKEYQVDPDYECIVTDPAFLDRYCRLIMARDGFYHRRACLYQFRPETIADPSRPEASKSADEWQNISQDEQP